MLARSRRPRKCGCGCGERFTPLQSFQRWATPDCAIRIIKEKRKKEERKIRKERKESIKTARTLKTEAQAAFNAWIRWRDRFQTCICCGKPFEPSKPGGSMDAGHFRSIGSAPHLRFNEDNCHSQRKNCNRPGGTTYDRYRAGLVARIGLERVEIIEADQDPLRYRAEDYRRIRDEYREKLKEARKGKL